MNVSLKTNKHTKKKTIKKVIPGKKEKDLKYLSLFSFFLEEGDINNGGS